LGDAERLEIQGRAELGLGMLDQAEQRYAALAEAEPGSVPAALGTAGVVAARGDTQRAIEQLENLLAEQPGNVDAWLLLGTLQQRLADYAAAIAAFDRARGGAPRQINLPRYFDILVSSADANLSAGNLPGARERLAELDELVPNAPPTHYLYAKVARADGDYDEAARRLQQLLQLVPESLPGLYMLGQVQLLRGNLEQSADLLTRVVALSPTNVQARKLLAQVRLRQSRPDAALETLTPVIEGAAEDAAMQRILAAASLQQGDTAAAMETLVTLNDLAPGDVRSQLGLASLHLEAGDPKAALAELEKIELQADETAPAVVALTVLALQESGDRNAARARAQAFVQQVATLPVLRAAVMALGRSDAEGALELLDGSAVAQSNVVEALALRGDVLISTDRDAARSAYQAVIEQAPGHLQANLQLARLFLGDERPEDAKVRLQAAIAGHPEAPMPRMIATRIQLQEGDLTAADRSLNELVSLQPKPVEITLAMSEGLAELGRFEDALAQVERALGTSPNDALLLYHKARVLLGLQRNGPARSTLLDALVARSDFREARTMLAMIEVQEGMFASAEENIARLERDHPDIPSVWLLKADWFAAQQRWQEAEQAYVQAGTVGAGNIAALRQFQVREAGGLSDMAAPLRRWVRDNPDDLALRMVLAQHSLGQGDFATAATQYEAVVALDDSNTIALNNLAWHYQQQGDLARAAGLAEQAYAQNAESGPIADTLGWIYHQQGQTDKALSVLRRAATLAPDNPEIQYHVAAALRDSGRADEARDVLESLLASNGQFPSRDAAEALLAAL
ncbi:MAG: XrtA/PEP-CTERM system TPR-repeat protein PrsT, partial [Pseudomonadota bacterium]